VTLRSGWLSNGLLALGSLVVAVGVTEGAVRLVAPQPTGLSFQDRYGLAMHYPGITRYLPQYGHSVTFNSVGMRDREHSLEKPVGVFRVLLLGDSFMEALQVPFEASFPSLLERALTERSGRRVEVLNAGMSGWGTDDELRYLTRYGLKYRPDLVLVAMTLHNDISDNLRREWHAIRNGALVERQVAPMSFVQYNVLHLKAFLATRFQLYQLWRRVRHGGEIRQIGKQLNTHAVQLFREPTPAKITEGFELTDHLLSAIRDTSRTAGAGVAVVLLPLKYQLSDSIFAAFVQAAEVPPSEMQIGKPQAAIAHAADSLGIPVIDLLPSFRQWTADSTGPLYLEWDGHWNEAGHRLAAGAATEGLLRAGVVR
jgi:GDSL-like Lipase/Acylhydrolase family